MENKKDEFRYCESGATHANEYLWKKLEAILKDKSRLSESTIPTTILDVGCGNGATCNMLNNLGFNVTGIDPSKSGINIAKEAYPKLYFINESIYEKVIDASNRFDIIISLEVIEHCYYPRKFADKIYTLLKPGGLAIISTPYHGYFKNLAIALLNKSDFHYTALWDGGHIKFWSKNTLTALLEESGFKDIYFKMAGRFPPLSKSMIAVTRKPLRR